MSTVMGIQLADEGNLYPTNPDILSQTDTTEYNGGMRSHQLNQPPSFGAPMSQWGNNAATPRQTVRQASVTSRGDPADNVRRWTANVDQLVEEEDDDGPKTPVAGNNGGNGQHAWDVTSLTATDFPALEGPNVAKLQKLYYRVFAQDIGAIRSENALRADDHSLARVNVEWVQPPGLAGDFRRYICSQEKIHPSRAVLFSKKSEGSAWVKIPDGELIEVFSEDGVGSELKPLKLVVELGSAGLQGKGSSISPLRSLGRFLCQW